MGQLNAARRESPAANSHVVEALTEASIANAKKDLLQKELKEKTTELKEANKKLKTLSLQKGALEENLPN